MKIFISNLSLLVTEDDLDLIFKPFGEVGEIKILRDRQSDLPLAFVEMKNDGEARAAINVLDGIELIGHTITLRVRNSDGERRTADNRRIEEIRRVLSIRRSAQLRRLNVAAFDSYDKRSDSDRRSIYERREIAKRRIEEKRRVSIDRRVFA